MSWRALGCGGLAAAVFVLVAVIAILRADVPPECPASLPYSPAPYRPIADPAAEPRLPGSEAPLELSGSFGFGFARWDLWLEPGGAPSTDDDLLPPRIVLDCGDGTYRAYERGSG